MLSIPQRDRVLAAACQEMCQAAAQRNIDVALEGARHQNAVRLAQFQALLTLARLVRQRPPSPATIATTRRRRSSSSNDRAASARRRSRQRT